MTGHINNNFKATIVSRIDDLAKAETTSRAMLALLSRDLLTYVLDTGDIGMVNRTLAACKTRNRGVAFVFFNAFLPWKCEGKDDLRTFTTKSTNKDVVAKCVAAIGKFLADENNSIWTWADENVAPVERKVDYAKQLTNTVARALDKDKGGMSPADVLAAIHEGGITIASILSMADEIRAELDKANPADMSGDAPIIEGTAVEIKTDEAPALPAPEVIEAAKPAKRKAASK